MKTSDPRSLQMKYAAPSICYGCGPANAQGLHVSSITTGTDPMGEVVCDFTPEKYQEAFPGVLNGGIIGALLDCHSNWTAAWHLMARDGLTEPPCTVTADYAIKLLRPTPTDGPLHLVARVVESSGPKATVEATLYSAGPSAGVLGKACATCRGTFVAVREGHPAFHRW